MSKRLRVGLLTLLLSAICTVAIGQTATGFIYTKNTGARTNAIAPLTLTSTTTSARWVETDATADNKSWEWAANGEQFRLGALTDAGVLGANSTFMLLDRTGNTADTITYPTARSLFTLAGTGITFPISMESALPGIAWNESDAALDEKWWRLFAQGGLMTFGTRNDANGTSADFWTINRNGNTIDQMVWTNASGSLTMSTGLVSTLTMTAPAFNASSTQPVSRWIETDATTNEQIWDVTTNGGDISFRTRTDVDGAGATWLSATRTGTTIDGVTITAPSLSVSGIMFAQGGRYELENTAPIWQSDETDAPADERSWLERSQGGNWFLSTATDAAPQTAVNNAIQVQRTGTTVDSISLTGTSIDVNGVSVTDFARLSQSNTFTGTFQRLQNTGGPRVVIQDSDAGADTQCYFMLSQSGQFDLYASSDANCTSTTGAESFLQATRSGVNIVDVRHPNGVNRFNSDHSPIVNIGPTIADITSRSNTTNVVGTLQVNGSAAAEATQSITRANGANSAGPILFLNKSRGTIAAPTTVVASGDDIGRIVFSGSDSANFSNGAEITAQVDGTPGANDMPGRLLFSTTADGATLPTERLRIDSAGLTTITGNASVTGKVTATNGVTATAGVNAGNRFSATTQSPTSLSANTNDWALTPVPIVIITASASVNITGISASTANADAQSLGNNVMLYLLNTSANTLTLVNESASSTAANRFSLTHSINYVLPPNGSASVYYDSVASRWRLLDSGGQVETGSFTVNYGTACTTTPSQTWDYIKIGQQVTIKLDSTSGFPCTGDVTGFSSGAVPANLIPTDNAISPIFGDGGCQDNGTVVSCGIAISGGGLGLMSICDFTGGAACNATGWQAAGNRSGPALGVTWTYMIK